MVETRVRGMKVAAVLAIGFLIAGASVSAASATTVQTGVVKTVVPQCVPVAAVEYQAAVDPTYETIPNPEYVPAVEEVSHLFHHDAVTHVEYYWVSWNWRTTSFSDTKWSVTDPGTWWYPDAFPQTSRVVTDTEAWDEKVIDTLAADAIGDPTIKQMTAPGSPEVAAVAGVTCPEILTEWYTWDTGSWTPGAQYGSNVSWPQTLVGMGQIAPTACETTYQQDMYVGTRAQIDAVIGDNLLVELSPGQYEDRNLVQNWHFASSLKCPPVVVPVEVQPTVTTTDICGPDNATLVGNVQDGVVWSEVTKSEDGTLSITASPATGYSFPENSQTTFTMKDSGKACPVGITAVMASVIDPPVCGPNNDVLNIPTTEGVTYSDTNWVDGKRTITATANEGYTLVGTASWTFTDQATACPTEVKTVTASVIDPPVCGPNNDVLNIPTTEGVIYSDTSWVDGTRTITATAAEGYVLQGQTSWTFHDENVPCSVTTVAPTVVAKCFPNNDTVTIPEAAGVIYSDTSWVDGKRTITASPAKGYALIGDTTWTFTDVPSGGCAQVGSVFSAEDPSALAFTGAPSNTGGLVALAIVLITSGTALVARKVREW